MRYSHCALLTCIVCAPALARAPDKSAFTLLNPTPRELMREMSTDRPDTTESPYTVDAGHAQVELSFFDFSREDRGPRTDSIAVAPINLKIGLLNTLDLQLILTPYQQERTAGDGSISGTSDITLRAKLNLLGNDGGDLAIAAMPYLTLPTGSDQLSAGAVEGGLIIPVTLALPAGFALSMMAELDIVRDDDQRGRHAELLHTVSLSHDLTERVGAFLEFAGREVFNRSRDYQATLDAGATLALTPDVQLDGGVRIGLTESAPDYAVFAGLSLRF